MDQEQRERYARHILLREVGGQGQRALMDARVLIVGAGGLGAPILQYLTAAGIGMIGVVDDDVVSLSNLQRQVAFRTADIGRAKTDAAADFAAALNPHVKIVTHRVRLDAENAADLVGDYDLVLEGVDNFDTRFALNAACIARRTPLISAAVGRFDGQLATYKPFADPGVLPCYRCFVPDAPPRDDQVTCAEDGVLGAVTGVMGTLAAMEAIKEIVGLDQGAGQGLAGRLLIYDGLAAAFRTVAMPADPDCRDCAHLRKD